MLLDKKNLINYLSGLIIHLAGEFFLSALQITYKGYENKNFKCPSEIQKVFTPLS